MGISFQFRSPELLVDKLLTKYNSRSNVMNRAPARELLPKVEYGAELWNGLQKSLSIAKKSSSLRMSCRCPNSISKSYPRKKVIPSKAYLFPTEIACGLFFKREASFSEMP